MMKEHEELIFQIVAQNFDTSNKIMYIVCLFIGMKLPTSWTLFNVR